MNIHICFIWSGNRLNRTARREINVCTGVRQLRLLPSFLYLFTID